MRNHPVAHWRLAAKWRGRSLSFHETARAEQMALDWNGRVSFGASPGGSFPERGTERGGAMEGHDAEEGGGFFAGEAGAETVEGGGGIREKTGGGGPSASPIARALIPREGDADERERPPNCRLLWANAH